MAETGERWVLWRRGVWHLVKAETATTLQAACGAWCWKAGGYTVSPSMPAEAVCKKCERIARRREGEAGA